MVSVRHRIETNHEELIHDSFANYHGTRLASCGSDNKIKIFELNGDSSRWMATLEGHEGPVWQLDWSHPEYGNLLASCSYDRTVMIWKESNGKWERIKVHKDHDCSVVSVAWAPREFGLMLACASADQSVSILKFREDEDWDTRKIRNAHAIGVLAVSWAPPTSSISIYRCNPNVGSKINNPTGAGSSLTATSDGTALSRPVFVERLVTSGCDSLVKIWKYERDSDQWIEERQLEGHTDWVRDVAWAPSIGLPKWYIASGSQDKRVIIWTNTEGPNGHEWESKVLNDFNDTVWHVSWSAMGNILAVSYGENKVSLWKEDMNGEFRCISEVQAES
jgi:protein transport protein SEC13